jgi:hypothetical protein
MSEIAADGKSCQEYGASTKLQNKDESSVTLIIKGS